MLGFCALMVLAVAARPHVTARYHRWRTGHHLAKAAENFSKEEYRFALISAQNALGYDRNNVEATRIVTESLDALGHPEAPRWRVRYEQLKPGDIENTLARANDALKTNGVHAAEEILSRLDAPGRETARFHALAAAIAWERKDGEGAEAHWAEAVRLAPPEKSYQLSLVRMRLEGEQLGKRDEALSALAEMRRNPATSVEAIRLLLSDAIRNRDAARIREISDALVVEERSVFADKLARLSSLRLIQDQRSGPYMLELRDAAMSEPSNLSALLLWLNANSLSMMVAEWVRWMPPEILTRPPVSLPVAEAYLRMAEWRKLEELTGNGQWGELDFLRKAFLASALEHLDDEEDGAKMWADAVAAARGHSTSLERLVKFALQVKWNKRAEEAMWMLTMLPQSPRWVTEYLWQKSQASGDTKHLHKLSRAAVRADPHGIASRNNFAFLSLLTRSDDGNPHGLAEALHRENPGNATVTSTYALSRYQLGKVNEAVALMGALGAKDLEEPQIALYHAIFLFAANQPEKAEQYLRAAEKWTMLPEERILLERVRNITQDQQEPAAAKETAGDERRGGPEK